MKQYQNVMESVVEETLQKMLPELDCCTCEHCQNDIIAWALNHIPPRYVATRSGSAISKADSLRSQHMTDVRTALVQATQVVKTSPRH